MRWHWQELVYIVVIVVVVAAAAAVLLTYLSHKVLSHTHILTHTLAY